VFKKVKELALDALAFFIFSLLLLAPMELIGGGYSIEVNAIFMESMAPRSIMALFVASTMSAAFVMFIFGERNREAKFNNFFYEHIVCKVTNFGMSFSSAGVGMLTGLSLAAVVNSEKAVAVAVLITACIFAAYWLFFSAINYALENGFGQNISSKETRALLFVAFIGAPMIYAISHEPVKEVECEERANKSKHADLIKLSPFSLAQKSHQLHHSGV
jgi:hypothetical protein